MLSLRFTSSTSISSLAILVAACGGDQVSVGSAAFVLSPGPAKARSLAGGFAHTCARLTNGSVKCWGNNDSGQLGLGDTKKRGRQPGEMGSALPFVDLGVGRTAFALTAGNAHTCALLDDGSVKCWGDNELGQLGLGDTTNRGDLPGQMGDALPAVDLGPGRRALEIAAGGLHTCARLDDGALKCWGFNQDGRLGLGNTNPRGSAPGQMAGALPAVDLGRGRSAHEIAAGDAFTCARLDDGSVKCWGDNSFGELGLGDTSKRGAGRGQMGRALPTVSLGSGRTAVGIVAGDSHACVRLDDGSVKCWGDNSLGELGLGDRTSRGNRAGQMGNTLPTIDLGAGLSAVELAAGKWQTCARLDDGSVKCWGVFEFFCGSLTHTCSLGTGTDRADRAPPVALGEDRRAIEIVGGSMHTCARLDDDSVKCWGYNLDGQLGRRDTDFQDIQNTPPDVPLPAVELE